MLNSYDKGASAKEEAEAKLIELKVDCINLLLEQFRTLSADNKSITDAKQKRLNIKLMLEIFSKVIRY